MQNLPEHFQPGRRNGGRRSNAPKRLTYFNRAQILMNDPNTSPRRFSYSVGQTYEIAGSSGGQQKENLDMTIEIERLKTFQNRWDNPAVLPQDLARYGFFYAGTADAVQCAFCNGRLQDWRSFDDPLNEHLIHYPQCPFVLGCNAERTRQGMYRSTNSYPNLQDQPPPEYSYQTALTIARSSSSRRPNGPVVENSAVASSDITVSDEAQKSLFKNIENLSLSLTGDNRIDWANTHKKQEPPSLKQTILAEMNIVCGESCSNHFVTYSSRISSFANWPKQNVICGQMLADAGFYYTGEKDRTRCFHCGITLINWEKGDLPWDMHDRFSPKCSFLLLCRNTSPESAESCSKTTIKVDDQPLIEILETVDGKESLEELNDKMRKLFASWRGHDAVRFALDAGYDEDIISRALIANSCEMFQSACELLDKIDTLLLVDSRNNATKNAGDDKADEDNASCSKKKISHEKQHYESKVCFICMDAETSVVFLPCAHLVCCPRCSLAMTQCPICRTVAQGRLRIYV